MLGFYHVQRRISWHVMSHNGEFSETLVAKMSKEPQPPLGGVFGKEHFGDLTDIEDPMEEDIDVPEEIQAP